MAINYAVKKTKNPKGIEGTEYFHGRVVKTSDYTFEDLASDINDSTTVTRALLAGQAVVLQDLGRLQIGLRGKCYSRDAMAASDFSPASFIKGHKVVFRPEVKLKADIARGFSLKRISSEAMK